MPHLLRLMKDGQYFPNAIVGDPLCCPSRATAMTGQYAHNHGVKDLSSGWKLDTRSTVQYVLQRHGYQTAIVGKYLQGLPNTRRAPYFDCSATWLNSNYLNFEVNVDGHMRDVDRYATKYAGERLRHCLGEFEESDRSPWYAYWTPHAPHFDPVRDRAVPERRYKGAPVPACVGPGERNMSDKPAYVRRHSPGKKAIRRYCKSAERALMTLDDEIAKVKRWLRAHHERNTLVIYWSDNGQLYGQHNRIGKSVPYLPSISVPMFMWWPGQVKPEVDKRFASNVDLAPTILSAAGVRPRTRMDGHSLLTDRVRSVQYSEYFRLYPDQTFVPRWSQLLRPRAWSYIESHVSADRVVEEYYDLRADPRQNRNLLGDTRPANDPPQDRLRALHMRLKEARGCAGTQEGGARHPCP